MTAADILGPLVTLYSVMLGGFAFIIKQYEIDTNNLEIARKVAGTGLALTVVPILALMYTTLQGTEQDLLGIGQPTIFVLAVILISVSLWFLMAMFVYTTD